MGLSPSSGLWPKGGRARTMGLAHSNLNFIGGTEPRLTSGGRAGRKIRTSFGASWLDSVGVEKASEGDGDVICAARRERQIDEILTSTFCRRCFPQYISNQLILHHLSESIRA
jgi:hypothetical protein